jgi:hypothetical protein
VEQLLAEMQEQCEVLQGAGAAGSVGGGELAPADATATVAADEKRRKKKEKAARQKAKKKAAVEGGDGGDA